MYNNYVIGYIINQYNEHIKELEYSNKLISNKSLLQAKREQNKRRLENNICTMLKELKELERLENLEKLESEVK